MKSFLYAVIGGLLVTSGVVLFVKPAAAPTEQVVGASASPDHYGPEYFHNTLYANQFYQLSSVSASTTSTTPLSLGASASGQITIGTSTPATNAVFASTTAVTSLTSLVFVQQTTNSNIVGVTCNATATTTPLVKVFASSTNPSLNGFSATSLATPVTNPICLDYWVVNTTTSK